ncbi:Uncharacterised protein [Mycobacteroides abscessus subsp. abscessus]|nr:Uncharacterised protein [Mycobacteroides abscessus subsp. abscessus]
MFWIRVDLIAGRQHQQVNGVMRTICGIYAVLGDTRNRFNDQLNLAGIHCLEKVARQDGAPREDAVTGHQRLAQLRILDGATQQSAVPPPCHVVVAGNQHAQDRFREQGQQME